MRTAAWYCLDTVLESIGAFYNIAANAGGERIPGYALKSRTIPRRYDIPRQIDAVSGKPIQKLGTQVYLRRMYFPLPV